MWGCKNTYSFRCQPGVELVFEESDPSLVISTDRNRLFQVFSNLIGNATKFTAKGSISFGYKLKEKRLFSCSRYRKRYFRWQDRQDIRSFHHGQQPSARHRTGAFHQQNHCRKVRRKNSCTIQNGNRDHIHFYIALHFGKRRYEMGGKTYTGFH